ncbi:hypothetical protein LTA6_000913 [Microbacterium sp. LTA6]|uniref:hypothetical protein n=1 Tax=Microbacterium sp. LTA6 TaxID=3129771 RepID=UPI00324E9F09
MSASDPHLIGPGLLPTPFTAAQIRDATGAGKTIRLRVELPDGSDFERVNRFRETDAEGATLDRWSSDAPDDVASGRVTWVELQGHAAFPAERTTLSTETLELPIGRVECLRYVTRDAPDAEPETFWFSIAHPGMPVRYEAPADGGVIRTTVVSIERD